MTYCVALSLKDGLVFASDSRTNAGPDYVTSYSKMHVFETAPDRCLILLSAGNLATTQEVVNHIRRDLAYGDGIDTLNTVRFMFEAADYVGRASVAVQQKHSSVLQNAGVAGETTLILGGQIQGEPPRLFLIYPQGNTIEVSETTPYLQIGENKYGKPVLDRVVDRPMSLEDGARLALVSLSSTSHSNTAVGPPYEVCMYKTDSYAIENRCRFEEKGPYFTELDAAWKRGLQQTFDNLPRFAWEPDNTTGNLFEAQAQPQPVQQAGANAAMETTPMTATNQSQQGTDTAAGGFISPGGIQTY